MFSQDETCSSLVTDAVSREVGEIDDGRSRTTVERDGSVVTLEIDARDLTALRAALNTWFTLIDVAERTAEVGDQVVDG